MAYGTLKADSLVYDDGGSDSTPVTISSLGAKADLGSPDFTTDITLKAQAPVKFEDDTGGEYVGLKAPTGVTTYTVSLPATAPAENQVLKATSATALAWAADNQNTILDEDDFASNSAASPASQQSVKAYVDTADALKAPINNPTFTGHIAFEGATANDFETALAVVDPTADRTITFTDATGTVPLLQSDQTWTGAQRGDLEPLTSSSNSTAVNLSLSNNFILTLGENSTLAQPSFQAAGQSGSIFVVQNGTGGYTLGYHADWKWSGGSGSAPTVTADANAVSRIDYIVQASNKIHAVATLAVA